MAGTFVTAVTFSATAAAAFTTENLGGYSQDCRVIVGSAAASVTSLTLRGSGQGEQLVGRETIDFVFGEGGADVLVGAGGVDELTGGAGADVFRYLAVSDSAPGASDLITDFEHGVDKIDLTGITGGVVNIVHDGAGASYLFYAPERVGDTYQARGAVRVLGDVEDADVVTELGLQFIDTGSFAAPASSPAFGHAAAWPGVHPDLF